MAGIGEGAIGLGPIGVGETSTTDPSPDPGPEPEPLPDPPTWRITAPDSSDPAIRARFEADPKQAHRPGETLTFAFVFDPLPRDSRGDHEQRHARLLDYERIAGQYASGLDYRSRPWFREQHGTAMSCVVAIRPPEHLRQRGVRGCYGLVSGIEDRTNLPLTQWGVTLTVEYLAELDEFDSPDAVADALEANGL